jgi:DNA-binding CsgD family transcriptional regulator
LRVVDSRFGIERRNDMARSRTFQKVSRGDKAEANRSLDVAQDRIDLLRSRAGLLRGKDGVLMQMYLNGSGTLSQMARLAGVNEANVARRIHKLVRRLLDGQYIACLRSRDKLTQEQIEMARDYFVDGLPMMEIADRHEITYYEVRKTMRKIQRLTSVSAKED